MSIETTPDAQPSSSASLARADERLRIDLLPFHAAGNDLLLILGLFYLLRLTSIPYSVTEAIVPDVTMAGLAIGGVVVQLVPIVVLTAVLTAVRKLPRATLGLASQPNSRDLCAALGVGFGLCAVQFAFFWGLLALPHLLWRAFGLDLRFLEDDREYLSRVAPVEAVVLFAGGAAGEELLFRSLLLPRLRVVCGNWLIAVVAGAVVFTIGHDAVAIVRIASLLFTGLVFGWLFVATQSLPATVLAHVIYNMSLYFALTAFAEG